MSQTRFPVIHSGPERSGQDPLVPDTFVGEDPSCRAEKQGGKWANRTAVFGARRTLPTDFPQVAIS